MKLEKKISIHICKHTYTNILFILEKHFRLFHEHLVDMRRVVFAILLSQLKLTLIDIYLSERSLLLSLRNYYTLILFTCQTFLSSFVTLYLKTARSL